MKKIGLLGAVLGLIIFFGCVNSVFAYAYPRYLNGDPNYILTYGYMNYGTYLIKSSVKVMSESSNGIIYTVDTVSGLVLARNDDWIVPAKNIRYSSMDIMRIYSDPWNVVYTYDPQNQIWVERDLSNTFGYNQGFLGIIAESWKILTGSPYPNLIR